MLMQSSIFSMAETAACPLNGTSWSAPSGMPAATPASEMHFASALFERNASLPPRRMTALPDLMQSPAASTVTFGRDS